MNEKMKMKSLQIIPFILLIFVLCIIVVTPPSSGYELSVYAAYPWYFWLIFIGVMLSSIVLIVHEVYTKNKSNQWILGFSAILIGNFVLLLLPLFRAYCFYGGAGADIFSHIGWIKEISQSGYVSENNFYPIIHIFIKSISDLLGISVANVIQFIPAFFSILYTPFMFLLARTISKNIGQALLITLFSFPLIYSIFHLTIHPAFLSFVFLPLLLHLYYKRLYLYNKKDCPRGIIERSALIIILCFFIVFFHPITTLIAIVIFITFIGSTFLLRKIKPFLNHNIVINNQHDAIGIVLILTVSFFAWYTSHGWGLSAINSIYQNLIYGSDFTIATHYLSTFSIANLTIFQTIRLIILRYGPIIIYGVIAFLCLMMIGKKLVFHRKIRELEFSYSLQLIVAFLFALVMIIGNFIVANPIRSIRYFIMMATVFNGLIIYSLLKTKKKKEHVLLLHVGRHKTYFDKKPRTRINKKILFSLLIIIILFFTIVVCIFNVYPSPVTWQGNRQFTHMNFAGSAWMVKNRDVTVQASYNTGFNLERIEQYYGSVKEGNMRIKKEGIRTPTHFGYNHNETLYQVFNYTTTYMITTENDRQAMYAFPENVRHKAYQYNKNDFERLNADITTNKIYENGEFEVWKTYGH